MRAPTLWHNTYQCPMQYSSNKMAGQRMREFGLKKTSQKVTTWKTNDTEIWF